MGAVRTNIKRGVKVIENIEGESIRSKVCLCLRCVRLVTDEDIAPLVTNVADMGTTDIIGMTQLRNARIEELKGSFNCPVAQANFMNCVIGEVAAPITRCPMFLDKSRLKSEDE